MDNELSNRKSYAGVYLVLLVFTILTVTVSQMNLGRSQAILIALSIAGIKAVLIALYFMHLRFEKPLIYGIVLLGIITVTILAIGIFPDIAVRL